MHRYEQRLLAEIENRLTVDDPEFARTFSHADPPPAAGRARLVLGVFTGVLAVICLLINDAAGFALCTALSAALITTRSWHFWSS
ncbi:DUF3040 domain-containing protein [Saccharopolyspora gloriosae]|uniref:DUF3040 domain-containing protein n=1 Tax=Saccharopolyspora gloriosae TaxID=455344 RepID=UPI001FB56E18|nr:DUF3040 domain-containing protein [Saccharopolyspora gloriosae]